MMASLLPEAHDTQPQRTDHAPRGPRKRERLLHRLPVAAVFLIGTATSGAAFVIDRLWQTQRIDSGFRSAAFDLTEHLREHLHDAVADVRALHSLYSALDGRVSRKTFADFAGPLTAAGSGIRAVEWAPRIGAAERRAFERRVRSEGKPDFLIREFDGKGFRPAGERDEYFPVLRLAPLAGHERALGFDLASETTRLAAMATARDTGRPALTAPLRLVQEVNRPLGVLLFIPLFAGEREEATTSEGRRPLRGFSVGVIRIDGLINPAAHMGPPFPLYLQVRDAAVPGPEGVLYAEGEVALPDRPGSITPRWLQPDTLFFRRTLPLADRALEITVTPARGFPVARRGIWPAMTLIVGLILTSFMTAIVALLQRRKDIVENLVDVRTRELADATARLAAREEHYRSLINEPAVPMMLIDRDDGRVIEANPAACTYYDCSPDQIAGIKISDIHGLPAGRIASILAQTDNEPGASFCFRHRMDSGEVREIEVHATPITVSGRNLLFAILHDVTERRNAEAALIRSEARYDELVRRIPAGVYLFRVLSDHSMRFDYVSPRFCELLGIEASAVLKDVDVAFNAVDPEDLPRLLQTIDAAIRQPSPYRWEGRLRGQGSPQWIRVEADPDVLPDGGSLWSGIVFDITERREVEDRLLERETHLRQAQEIGGLGSFVYDFTQRRWSGSPVLHRLLGIDDAADAGVERWLEPIHPDDRDRVLERLASTRGCGRRFDCEYRIIRSDDGAERWVHALADIETDEQFQPRRTIGTLRDITTLKLYESRMESLMAVRTAELAASEARFRAVVEQSLAGIYIIEGDHFRYVNRQFATIFGYDRPEDIIDRVPILDLVSPNDRKLVAEQIRKRLSGEVSSALYGFTAHRLDGRAIDVEVHGCRLDGNGTATLIGILLDVTERKRAESAREAALAAADRLSRLKTEFIAGISQELLTPMNAVLGLAAMGLRSPDLPTGLQTFGRILESGQRLVRVVDDIADFSAIDAGGLSLQRQPFDLSEVINRATIPASAQGVAKGLTFRLELAADLPTRVCGDPRRVTQIVGNLLSNAVKFTDRGQVALSAERDGAWLLFRVSDTGIGMSAEHIERAFHPFESARTRSSGDAGASGLGLALSHHLAGKMGGSMTIDSTRDVGTRVDFRLPLVEPESADAISAAPVSPRTLSGVAVLCIDDNAVTRLIVGDLLVSEGASVTLANDGEAALGHLRAVGARAVDIVLVDLEMHDIDGYALSKAIRDLDQDLPILGLLSDPDHRTEPERCRAAGLAGYLVKPIDPSELISRLRRHARAEPLGAAS